MERLEDNPNCFPPDPRPVIVRESNGRPPSEEDIPRGRHIQSTNQVEQRTLPAAAEAADYVWAMKDGRLVTKTQHEPVTVVA